MFLVCKTFESFFLFYLDDYSYNEVEAVVLNPLQ